MATKHTKERIYTESQVNQLCKAYQKLLRIDDWAIEVKFVEQDTMKNKEARVTKWPQVWEAYIEMVSPDSRDKKFIGPYDMQLVLMHELLHVSSWYYKFKGKKHLSLRDNLYESFIERTAEALCRALPEPFTDTEGKDE